MENFVPNNLDVIRLILVYINWIFPLHVLAVCESIQHSVTKEMLFDVIERHSYGVQMRHGELIMIQYKTLKPFEFGLYSVDA